MVFIATPDSLHNSTILPSLTPTSPRKAGIPEPSTTRPFLISKSYAIGSLRGAGRPDGDRLGDDFNTPSPPSCPLSPHGSRPSHARSGGEPLSRRSAARSEASGRAASGTGRSAEYRSTTPPAR